MKERDAIIIYDDSLRNSRDNIEHAEEENAFIERVNRGNKNAPNKKK